MNERIEKFIDDAKLTAVSEMFESELEKFAEMIVAECAEVGNFGDPLQDGGIGKMIKQHFGLK